MFPMKHAVPAFVALVALTSALAAPTQAKKAAPAKGYPAVDALFKKQCIHCHSGAQPAGGFDVSTYAKVMKGTKQGKMVIAGKPDKSPLVAYLKGTKKPAMPIGTNGLKKDELKIVTDWIAKGAKNK